MKTTLFVLCLFCATGVWGQSAVGGSSLSYEPVVSWAPSHAQHASQQARRKDTICWNLPGSIMLAGRNRCGRWRRKPHLRLSAMLHAPCDKSTPPHKKPLGFGPINHV